MIYLLVILSFSLVICTILRPANFFTILFPVVVFYPRILPQLTFLGGAHGDDLILILILVITIIKEKKIFITPISKWLFVFFFLQIMGLLSGVITDHIRYSIGEAIKGEIKNCRPLIYSLIVGMGLNKNKEIERFYLCLVATMSMAFLLMLIMNLFPSMGLHDIWIRETQRMIFESQEAGTQRYSGVLAGVWNAGVVGEVLTVFCISSIFSKIKIENDTIFYFAPLIALLALAASGTRTGSLVIVFGAFMVIWINCNQIYRVKKIYIWFFIIGISMIVIKYHYVIEMIGGTLLKRMNGLNEAFHIREEIWFTVLKDAFPDGLLFGVGNAGLINHAHNVYVWVFAVLGFTGVIYFYLMMVAIGRGLVSMKKIEKFIPVSQKYNMRLAIIAMLPCIAIHGLFDSIGYYSKEMIVLFCVVAYKWYKVHHQEYLICYKRLQNQRVTESMCKKTFKTIQKYPV